MKYIFILTLLLFGQNLSSQTVSKKRIGLKYSLLFGGGIVQGFYEGDQDHYPAFKRVFHIPDSKDGFYDYSESWKRKYKTGSTTEPRFPGSTGPLVIFTDFHHFSKATWITMSGIGFSIMIFDKFEWRTFIIETIGGFVAHKAGFILAYNVIVK